MVFLLTTMTGSPAEEKPLVIPIIENPGETLYCYIFYISGMAGSKEQIGRNCPYCGAIITYDEFFCRACHKRLYDQQDFSAPSTLKPEILIVGIRNPFIAGGLSLICPGLGQFYNGDTLKGLAFFIGFIIVSFGIAGQDYRTLLFFGIWVAGIIEAVWSTRRINNYERAFSGTSYFLYALLAIFALIAGLHLWTGQPDTVYLAKLFPPVVLLTG
jgi:TM2 domain-containing membrane protein YozV